MMQEGGNDMSAAPVKPIRPTVIEFEEETEMQRFINYATSKQKTRSEELERVREKRRKHKRAEEMK